MQSEKYEQVIMTMATEIKNLQEGQEPALNYQKETSLKEAENEEEELTEKLKKATKK